MTMIDLSADVALAALAMTTINICLGLLIASRYSPVRSWPHRRINIFQLHNWTAYLVLAAILLHPVLLLLSSKIRWRVIDIVCPVWSPIQPTANTIGAISAYVAVAVIVTSYFRLALGRARWRLLHYLVYPAAASIFVHGLLVDPKLKGNAFDPLDGEKLFIECCLVVVCAATGLAWRYRVQKDRQERASGAGRYRDLATADPGAE